MCGKCVVHRSRLVSPNNVELLLLSSALRLRLEFFFFFPANMLVAKQLKDRLPLGERQKGFSPSSSVSSSITHRRIILCLHISSLLFYL